MRDSLKDKCMAIDIAKLVNKQGGRTFYVGGYVRDEILNKPSKDVDIEVHGITSDELKSINEFRTIKNSRCFFWCI